MDEPAVPFLSRRKFLATAGIIGCGGYLLHADRQAAQVREPSPPAKMISVTDLGAVPNDERRADQNLASFNKAAAWAVKNDAILLVPSGVWYLTANDGLRTGWHINAGRQGRCRIRGAGRTSVIKRAATATAARSSSLAWLWAAEGGETYEIEGVCFDGNESQFPIAQGDSVADLYAHEQSHNLCLASPKNAQDKVAAKAVTLRDVHFTGCVADGFKVGSQCETMLVEGFFAQGRGRRVRSDLQFSRIPHHTQVTNAVMDAFEAEPSVVHPGAVMHLRDLRARTSFDLMGNKESPRQYLEVHAANVVHEMNVSSGAPAPKCIWYRVKGTFENSRFATGPARVGERHMGRIRECQLRFRGVDFTIGGTFRSPRTAAPFTVHHAHDGEYVEFESCRLGAASPVADGAYVATVKSAPSGDRHLRLLDCSSDGKLPFVVSVERGMRVAVEGGALRADTAIVKAASGVDAVTIGRTQSWSARRPLLRAG